MAEEEKPLNWGKDPLSEFIEDARINTLGTPIHHRRAYDLLNDINGTFENMVDHLDYSSETFSVFSAFRAHASYLGAVRLSISAQVCEAYMVLRGCLENALYGLYFFKNPLSRQVWLNRHNDAASKNLVRREFTIGNLLACAGGPEK